MNKYEGMFIIKPDLGEEEKKAIFTQINDAVSKNSGQIIESSVWAEKRKFCFPIKKNQEGLYYLVVFSMPPAGIKELRHAYTLNENIMRVMVTRA
ncbi:MAG: 30S ribosomal protein S6 [Candidatus Omnitrophica bacterium]|nr:30S ribosomal protein S6 [Candidatus Omnitrophota bacterium]